MKIIITIYTLFALNLTYIYSQSQILERGQSVLNVNVPLAFGTSDKTGIVYAAGLGYSAKGVVDFGFFVGKYSAYNQRQIRSKGTIWGGRIQLAYFQRI